MDKLDVGSLVNAELSIGRHPAIVLSTNEEVAATGKVFVVAISKNSTISHPDDLIEVPSSGLGLPKKCYVQCGVREFISLENLEDRNRKAWGPFLAKVLRQVKIATESGR